MANNRHRHERGHLSGAVRQVFSGYAKQDIPIGWYAALVMGYLGMVGVGYRCSRGLRRNIAKEIAPQDWLLLVLGSFKLSRAVTKDWVTIPFRAAFSRYKEAAGAGEVDEEARGSGLREALGELLTCQYCFSTWSAAMMILGFELAPDFTRFFARIMTLGATSDFLNFAYEGAREKSYQQLLTSERLEKDRVA